MRILITGVTGFAGSHLVDYCLTKSGAEIFGIQRWRSRTENIEHCQDRFCMYECDVRDASSVRDVIEQVKPEWIFHLAAQSFVPTSWRAPTESLTTNIIGELNIFEAVKKTGLKPRIQIAGSSEEYGMVYPGELPIRETNPLRPLSPYAVSKVAQDLLAYQYFMSFQLDVVRTRGFNHTGPRRAPVFVCSDFAKQIIEVERGKRQPIIYVGNMDAVRDFTDVRDMVRGYWLSLEQGKPGEAYNICSGVGRKISDVLDMLMELSGIKLKVVREERRMRPSDVPVLVGDNSKFSKETGWKPVIPFDQTLKDLLEFWRSKQ